MDVISHWKAVNTAVLARDRAALDRLLAHDPTEREFDQATTLLMYAAAADWPQGVLQALAAGCPLEASDTRAWTALHYAVAANSRECVRVLLKERAHMNAATFSGHTALALAAHAGLDEMVEALVEAGADLEATGLPSGPTAVHLAAAGGHAAVVTRLLDAGARMAAVGRKRRTLLHTACISGWTHVVQVVLERGGNVDAWDADGWTALMHACRWGQEDVARLLVEAGAVDGRGAALELACRHSGSISLIRYLISQQDDTYVRSGWTRDTLLHSACLSGNTPVLQELVDHFGGLRWHWHMSRWLDAAASRGFLDIARILLATMTGVDDTARDLDKALHEAASTDHLEMVKLLEAHGADINCRNERDETTPLMAAARRGRCEVTRYLASRVADINAADRRGCTALHWAAQTNTNTGTVEVLLAAGADPNQVTEIGYTALMEAVDNRRCPDIACMLIPLTADVHAANCSWKRSVLHRAAARGRLAAVEMLVRRGADVHHRDDFRQTPLHLACEGGHLSTVQALVEAGANVHVKSESGSTPLHCCAWRGQADVVRYLLQAGAQTHLVDTSEKTPLAAAVYSGNIHLASTLMHREDEQHWQEALKVPAKWTVLESLRRLDDVGAPVRTLYDRVGMGNVSSEEAWYFKMTRPLGSNVMHPDAAQLGRGLNRRKLHLLRCFLEEGLSPNHCSQDGMTLLMYAVEYGHTEAVQLMLHWGADVNAVDSWGRTALMLACKRELINMIRLLLQAGARLPTLQCVEENADDVNETTVALLLKYGLRADSVDTGRWHERYWLFRPLLRTTDRYDED